MSSWLPSAAPVCQRLTAGQTPRLCGCCAAAKANERNNVPKTIDVKNSKKNIFKMLENVKNVTKFKKTFVNVE